MVKTCLYPECGKDFYTKRSSVQYCSRPCSNKDKNRVRLEGAKDWQILSCGAGVQSTGMIAAVYSGKLPRPDMVIMVDTGWEKQATMRYVQDVLMPKCAEINLEFVILKTENNNIFSNNGLVLIPAHKMSATGRREQIRTMCNGQWKVRLIKSYLRSRGVKKATSWIGISTDEAHRQRVPRDQWATNRYPLLELGLSRYQCLYLVRSLGWPDPERSSCIMCPQHPAEEWEEMAAKHPDDLNRCIHIDNELEARNPDIYLHRSLIRLRDIIWRGETTPRGTR